MRRAVFSARYTTDTSESGPYESLRVVDVISPWSKVARIQAKKTDCPIFSRAYVIMDPIASPGRHSLLCKLSKAAAVSQIAPQPCGRVLL